MWNFVGSAITISARCTSEIKSRIATAKAAFHKKTTLVSSKMYLNLRQKLIKQHLELTCMVLKLGHFGQQIRNTWEVLKCDAGEA
jgi:hypothetical protein